MWILHLVAQSSKKDCGPQYLCHITDGMAGWSRHIVCGDMTYQTSAEPDVRTWSAIPLTNPCVRTWSTMLLPHPCFRMGMVYLTYATFKCRALRR